jgi:hypothetical protein
MFDGGATKDSPTKEELLSELKELGEIRKASSMCTKECLAEPAWNEEVHRPVLKLALESYDGVRYLNVYDRRRTLVLYFVQLLMLSSTTAHPLEILVPRHASGEIFKSEMVDYTINLRPDNEMENLIRLLLQSQPRGLQTINQSMYCPLRFSPIAISIETKTPDAPEQKAKIQLGMWAAAHFNRLSMFSTVLVLPTLPLLYVSGDQWFLLFACDRAERIVCSFPIHMRLACQVSHFAGTNWKASHRGYELCAWLLQAASCSSLPLRMGDDSLQGLAGTQCARPGI